MGKFTQFIIRFDSPYWVHDWIFPPTQDIFWKIKKRKKEKRNKGNFSSKLFHPLLSKQRHYSYQTLNNSTASCNLSHFAACVLFL